MDKSEGSEPDVEPYDESDPEFEPRENDLQFEPQESSPRVGPPESEPHVVGPPGATKLPLNFISDSAHPLDENVKRVIEDFRTVFEQNLWLWGDFSLELPRLLRPDTPFVTTHDLFPPPNFDELKQISTEPTGRGIPLSEEKLAEIRKTGEFHVPSANFPGQFHRWRLSVLLQKGTERGLKNLHKTLALALEMLVIFARNRFDGDLLSMRKSLHAFGRGICIFFDAFFGVRRLTTANYEQKLINEKFKYLMSDLTVIGEDEQDKMDLWIAYLERKREFGESHETEPLSKPYKYVTPRNLPINLILYDSTVLSRIEERLVYLSKTAINRKMFMEFRQIVLSELNQLNDTNDQQKLQEIASKSLKELLLPEYFRILKGDPFLSSKSEDAADLLIENYQIRHIADNAVSAYRKVLQFEIENLENSLKNEYPIRSKIQRWMKRQRRKCEEIYNRSHVWNVVDDVLEKVKTKPELSQFVYFFERNLHFEKEVEPNLIKDYENVKIPSRTFRWRLKIWMPENYIVKKYTKPQHSILPPKEDIVETLFNETELLPKDYLYQRRCKTLSGTMDSDMARSSLYDFTKDKKFEITYGVEKQTVRTSSTQYPFWRFTNFANRLWVWTWNSMFFFLLYVPMRSSVGLKALLWPTVFYPGFIVNQETGVLHPKLSSKTHSFVSRFRALWRHVHKSRVCFEITADSGFLSKSITRHFNRFWNYVLKGVCGSALLILCNPIICILVTTGSLLLGLTCPLWMPVVVLGNYLICIFVYDRDASDKHSYARNRIMLFFDMLIYRFLILGVGQSMIALGSAFVVLPICSALLVLFGYIRFGIRSFWDTVMFNVVIKRHGRIPMSDSFVARRVAGPGLSRNYVFQISVEQALVAAEHMIQVKELEAFEKQATDWIDMPWHGFKRFMNSIQKHSGLDGFNCMSRTLLSKQQADFKEKLEKLVAPRRKELARVDKDGVLPKIRMEPADLEQTLQKVAQLLQCHYPDRIFRRLCDLSVEAWWDRKTLVVNDWYGLAEQFCAKLFSPQFLIPLDDSQEHFKLDVQHVNMSRYMGMLVSGDHREDLDNVEPIFDSKIKKPISLRQPDMPVGQMKPFVYQESPGLGLLKAGHGHYFALPSLINAIPIIARDVD